MSGNEFIPDPNLSPLRQKLQRMKWEQEQKEEAKKASMAPTDTGLTNSTEDYSQFMDSVPDVSANAAEDDKRLETVDRQQFIDRISILDVYKKLTGNQVRASAGQTNSIMGFCVSPSHNNVNSEAMQMSTDNTWVCHACEQGASQVGMVAFSMGVSEVGAGKLRGQAFAKAEEQLLEMFGWTFEKKGNTTVAKSPIQQQKDKKAASENEEDLRAAIKKVQAPAAKEAETGVADVISITRSTDVTISSSPMPSFDWEKVVTPGTALDAYMQACRINSVPEEFHFFNSMMLVGLSVGRNVCGPVKSQFYGNIGPILVGGTGAGKSYAWKPVYEVLEEVMPFRVLPNGMHTGVQVAHGPGSGEDLYDVFSKAQDDVTGKMIKDLKQIKSVVAYSEVKHFMSKANSTGSVLETSLQNLYDSMFVTGVRSRSGGITKAYEPFMCIMSTSQPDVVGKNFTIEQLANGLAGRLDFVTGTYKEPDPFDNEHGDLTEAMEKYKELVTWGKSHFRRLEWSDEAALLWVDYFNEKIRPIKRSTEKSDDILKRVDLKIKKYALLFAINEMHDKIERSDLEKAVYMHDYIQDTLLFIAGTVNKSKYNEMSEQVSGYILEFYKEHDKPCNLRDIKRKFKRKYPEWEDLDYLNTVKFLDQLGEVVIQKYKPTRGPETSVYLPHSEMVK